MPEPNRAREFEDSIVKFLEKIKKLQERFSLENKIGNFPPVSIERGDELKIFHPGPYLMNIKKRDLNDIESLIEEWKRSVLLGTQLHKEIMRKYAGEIEIAYFFLSLRYRPFIYPDFEKREAHVKYEEEIEEEKKKIRIINQGFVDYFEKEIGTRMRKVEEEIKKMGRPISDKEAKEMIKQLYTEEELEEIKKLQERLRKGYNQEIADRLWKIWGETHQDEFLDVVYKGRKK